MNRINLVGKIGGGTVLLLPGYKSRYMFICHVYIVQSFDVRSGDCLPRPSLYFRLSVLPARTGVAGSQAHHQAR